MTTLETIWHTLEDKPAGKRLFSFAITRAAPYFATVKPRFAVVQPHYAELVVPKRRAVQNHLGTVHAIALCNGLEGVAAALAEMTVPSGKRWIPRGMEVAYSARASSDIRCIAETSAADWAGADVPVRVRGLRTDGTVVIEGTIHLWVSDTLLG